MGKTRFKSGLEYFIFVFPMVLFFFVLFVIPFFEGVEYSFKEWNGVSTTTKWVGFENYIGSFQDNGYRKALVFTVKFVLVSVVGSNLIGFALAYSLTRGLKLQNVLRTAFFVPQLIGGLVVGFVWRFIFGTSYKQLGTSLGLTALDINWFSRPAPAFWAVVITFLWQFSGYLMIIYIAALQSVPTELVEAAKIDGTKPSQLLYHVILPLIRHAFTICMFISCSTAFKIFDINMALTAGGPFGSTASLSFHIYNQAFTYYKYGLGSAQAVLFFLILALVTSIQVSVMKKKEVDM